MIRRPLARGPVGVEEDGLEKAKRNLVWIRTREEVATDFY